MSKNSIVAASALVALSGAAFAGGMGRTLDSMTRSTPPWA